MKNIGDKNVFAIEYYIDDSSSLTGFAKIWFGGHSLGTSEDLIYLKGYLFTGLDEIKNSRTLDFEYVSNKEQLYNFLYKRYTEKNNIENHKYSITSLGTFCDDFIIFSFVKDDDIYILWKLRNNKTPFFDLNNQSKRINFFNINKKDYTKILDEMKKLIVS